MYIYGMGFEAYFHSSTLTAPSGSESIWHLRQERFFGEHPSFKAVQPLGCLGPAWSVATLGIKVHERV